MIYCTRLFLETDAPLLGFVPRNLDCPLLIRIVGAPPDFGHAHGRNVRILLAEIQELAAVNFGRTVRRRNGVTEV